MVIVTGGAGFIGSNLVRGLNEIGITDIIIVDNLTNAEKHKNLNRIKFKDYIDKDDFNIYELEPAKIEAVFHQGASSNTMETDGRFMMHNNYEYSKNLFHACQIGKIPFLYASSASVYGNGDNGFKEDEECEYPLNVYAFSKYQFDRYVNNYFHYDLSQSESLVVGLRYFNVYGMQENHKGKMASVLFHQFHQYKRGESIKLFEGSENFKRDFIFVEDVVSVNIAFFQNIRKSGIYNCGTGHAEPFTKIAEAIKGAYPEAKVEYIPFPDNLKGKYQTFTEANLARLRSAGYDKPFMSLAEGAKKYLEYLEKSGGYLM